MELYTDFEIHMAYSHTRLNKMATIKFGHNYEQKTPTSIYANLVYISQRAEGPFYSPSI